MYRAMWGQAMSIPKPKQAIEFLERKHIVESENWDDLKWGEHAHAFTVAHSVNAGILDDLHQILINAMESGESFQKTKRKIKTLMAQKGWYGRAGIDPNAVDEEGKPDKTRRKESKKYINWRIGIIYQQNQLTAYSAGQTRKLWSVQQFYPFWQYKQRQRKTKRKAHSAYHDMVLRADDPAWDVLTPPNGWRCACYRSPLTIEQAEEQISAGAKTSLPSDGEIDPTWAYNPAKEALAPNWKSYTGLRKADALREIIPAYRQNMAQIQMSKGEWITLSDSVLRGQTAHDRNVPIHLATLTQEVVAALGFDPKLMAALSRIAHGGRGRKQKGQSRPERDLTRAQIHDMPARLADPEQIFWDDVNQTWLFVYKLNKTEEARVVFRQNGNRPLQLLTYTKVPLGKTGKQSENVKIYQKE